MERIMKVVVLGGGVIGVSAAYDLARAGAEVEVFDRCGSPALETAPSPHERPQVIR
jgi:D-amino-acid dehydrogenase